jgi:hypothetical protein
MEPVSIRSDIDGLQAMTVSCRAQAEVLASPSDAPQPGLPCQATSTAVVEAYAKVQQVGATLAARMDATATKAASAATSYELSERISTAALRGVA